MSAFACGPPVGPYTFTVEAGGAGNFWSQHGGQTVGSVTSGSVSLPGDVDLSRLWRRSATQFRLNQNGTGSLVRLHHGQPRSHARHEHAARRRDSSRIR